MAAAEAVMAAATTTLLYLVTICGRASAAEEEHPGGAGEGAAGRGNDGVVVDHLGSGRRRWSRRRRRRMYARQPTEPPETWLGKAALVVGTMRFTYSETIGRWPLVDLFFGIRHHRRRQGNREVASVYAGCNCLELKGCEIMVQLTHMLRLLTLCFLFSKKPYPVLLETAGYTEEDVLFKRTNAGLLKPAFTILRDRNSKSFLLLIRGALSIKDKLTAATSALVPFHHLVSTEGSIHNLVVGYAHSGMVAAAHWIAKCSSPCLLRAMKEYPGYNIKIIGHSMGAAIAALVTYVLREQEEFSSSTCVAFGPAACMSWELAESGKKFVTSLVNATDLVPTFSAVSADNLRYEIKASSWFKNKVQHTTFLKGLYHFMTALRSCMPCLSDARTKVTSDGKFLQPVATSTEVVIGHAAVTCCSSVSCRSCLTKSWRAFGTRTSPDEEEAPGSLAAPRSNSNGIDEFGTKSALDKPFNCSSASWCKEIDESEELLQVTHVIRAASVGMTENEFWFELKKEFNRHIEDTQGLEKGKEGNAVLTEAAETVLPTTSNDQEVVHQMYPPGKILHMVAVPALDFSDSSEAPLDNRSIGIYETPREMYGKIRLSQTMIDDHYMPRYKRMMELLIDKLKRENQ
ncbi:hypothetical protein Cni_G24598 [Canna indica]|uniref:Fungal lipase-type domain-containing protein n=1 Tax=Canna indica TaxID=4628 RepID=A0AAQ3KYD0_9LILI|nr:hypothetical protein Cni_G24598 [Canna indica]